jgi:hypothetical protein
VRTPGGGGGNHILADSAGGKTYLFWIRPTADSPGGIPRAWWLPGALGPLATLQASAGGLRIVRRSPSGTALQLGVGLAVGIGLIFGLWLPIAFVVPTRLGVTVASALLGEAVAFLVYVGVMLFLSPHIRRLAAWRPLGPFVSIRVLSVSLGSFHQELKIEGEGQDAWVRTNARRSTMTAALRLAHQMPPVAQAIP